MERITPVIDFSTELAGLYEVRGKVAYLPGGYGGICEAIVWELATRGAKVAVAGRSAEKAETLARQISEKGHEALGIAVDVKSVAEIRESTDYVVDRFGALDILVNCVGIQREELILEVTEEAYDEVYQSNLRGAMFLAQAAAKHQVPSGKGGKQVHHLSVRAMLGLRSRLLAATIRPTPGSRRHGRGRTNACRSSHTGMESCDFSIIDVLSHPEKNLLR